MNNTQQNRFLWFFELNVFKSECKYKCVNFNCGSINWYPGTIQFKLKRYGHILGIMVRDAWISTTSDPHSNIFQHRLFFRTKYKLFFQQFHNHFLNTINCPHVSVFVLQICLCCLFMKKELDHEFFAYVLSSINFFDNFIQKPLDALQKPYALLFIIPVTHSCFSWRSYINLSIQQSSLQKRYSLHHTS